MATMNSTARDVSKIDGRDSLTAVAAKSVPVTKAPPLPTPPNSISPTLPAYGIKPSGIGSIIVNEPVDSDLDLQDSHDSSGQDGKARKRLNMGSLLRFDAAGTITPSLLAKHHLPDILLSHGPLAIRHIMGYLTTSVPGFSGIPPTKARRLVVNALEGRGAGSEMGGLKGGLKGDVLFEKVGWGRWDARMKGRPGRRGISPAPSDPSSYPVGVPIVKVGEFSFDRTRLNAPDSSWAGDSAAFSHDDDMDAMMEENEADNMSLDSDNSGSSSGSSSSDELMEDDPDDVTDEEDWAAIGAAALRSASYSTSGPRAEFLHKAIIMNRAASGGGPPFSNVAKTMPLRTSLHPPRNILDISASPSNAQEREAIEALLKLGSV